MQNNCNKCLEILSWGLTARFALLTVFILFLPAPHGFCQDADHEIHEPEPEIILHVTAETTARTITAGSSWTLMLYINHSIPDEVTVITPAFAPSLFLDRIVKITGIVNAQIQTIIEYRFVPEAPGRFFIEPFTIITPHGRTSTERYILDVRSLNNESGTLTPRIAWQNAPRQMAAGERTEITLRITGWDSRRLTPDFFKPEIPRGAIFIPSQLSAGERDSGIVLKFTLIPLETGDLIFPPRTLQYENAVFQIPVLNIRVTSPTGSVFSAKPAELTQESEQDNLQDVQDKTIAKSGVLFPEFIPGASGKNIPESRRRQCESIYNKAKGLWDNGLYVQALAELRRNERNHPAGDLLRPVRREAERNLGFFNTLNENREHLTVLLILTFSFPALVIISLFICFFLKRGMFVKRASLVCAVIFAAAGLFCFYRYADSNTLFRVNQFGVANEASVLRTADYEGEELFRFREGQPVVIMLNPGDWVYVRANDAEGKSGWMSSKEIIFY